MVGRSEACSVTCWKGRFLAKLIVRHLDDSNPPQFRLVRQNDGKDVGPLTIASPRGFPVEGMPHSELMKELRWYLEVFLDYPFSPFTERAERIQAALRRWGTEAFKSLFGSREAGRFFDAATEQQYAELHLEISSDDPAILHWPWEALEDPEVGVLSRTCRFSRRLNKVRDPHPLSDQLPRDVINILLVTARPYQSDVQFRSISRPLVDLIARHKLPAKVTLLRPPTLQQLEGHLKAHPDHYHILHFDGHGSYGKTVAQPRPNQLTLQGPQGKLVFEDASGEPDPQPASVLSELMRDHRIAAVVLNACQSAMVDDDADSAFASVAAGLQQSGVRSVVAMAYSLYVSGAQEFLPAFYQRLFETGDAAEATRAGRRQAVMQPDRVCARGRFPLGDWLVPVLYEQQPVDLRFLVNDARAAVEVEQIAGSIPDEARDLQNPYGFIGRDGAVLELERAMHRPPAGILMYGLGGIGKTTLCRGFIDWLVKTNGLPNGCFWLSFQDIRSAEFAINHLVGTLFGTNALAAPTDQKLRALIKTLREQQFLIVWDNFEVVRGSSAEGLSSTLSEADQNVLADLLQGLRGGKTKVLITSRSSEDWLPASNCFRLPIRGLTGEERWEFCDAIVRDFGLKVDRTKDDWKKLIDELEGHPLAMRVVLSRLPSASPSQLITGLAANLKQFHGLDAESAKMFATLKFVQDDLPADLQAWLIPLSLHEHFVDGEYLKFMGKQLPEPMQNADSTVDRLMELLTSAGLLTSIGQGMFELHPVLSRFLQQSAPAASSSELVSAWQRSFVDVMATIADHFGPRELHEQRDVFHVHGASFLRALDLADGLDMGLHVTALTQSHAAFAMNTGRFQEANQWFLNLAEKGRKVGDPEGEAGAYHQLGRIAQEQRDFATAEQQYRKSLAIFEKQGNEHGAAITYHQLGIIAQEQRDFATAEQQYRKSLAIFEKRGNEHGAAGTYHQLGRIAEEQRDFARAEQWYRKSLAINEKQENEYGAAITYLQLGIIAQEQRDFATAEQWYRKSLAINEKQGNDNGAARGYHNLGIIAQEQRDFARAEQWYRKSLAIFEKRGNEYGAAATYHELGIIAQEQRDFATAEQWCRKSLPIFEKQGNDHGAAITYHQLGIIAQEQRDFAKAEQWYRKSLAIFEKRGNEHGAAGTYHQLGRIAQSQGQLFDASKYLLRAFSVFRKSNPRYSQMARQGFHSACQQCNDNEQRELRTLWHNENLGEFPEGESS